MGPQPGKVDQSKENLRQAGTMNSGPWTICTCLDLKLPLLLTQNRAWAMEPHSREPGNTFVMVLPAHIHHVSQTGNVDAAGLTLRKWEVLQRRAGIGQLCWTAKEEAQGFLH